MPFVTQEKRKLIDEGLLLEEAFQVGDRCYKYYKPMVDRWKANPRWTTAHEIFKEMRSNTPFNIDDNIAYDLAWQVFFNLYIIPFELKKRKRNGDVV